ncbi:MAG: neutral/alkaline non-lysosomal ceramidase N-terminal domain-containing protein [Sphingobacteriaceae bacterium]
MKRKFADYTLLFRAINLGVIAMVFLGFTTKRKTTNQLQVGVSYASITPQKGAFIAGDKNNRRFTGVHDSLYVKTIFLSDDGNNMVLLSFDCIGMLYPTLVEIRKAVSLIIPAGDLNPDHIIMASTHTHSGPDVIGIWGVDRMTSGIDKAYINQIIETSTKSIVTAWKNKQPATACYSEKKFGEKWVYNISDSLNLDRSLNVLQFLNKEGKSIATFTNFACHPTIIDGASSLVSADYISAMYIYLNQNLGGVNFFLQGSIGGWVQPEYEPKTFESVNKRGRELGIEVETALKNSVKMDGTSIHFKSLKVNLPVSNQGFQQLSAAGVIRRPMTDSVNTEIAWFSIGNSQFVTHPGETSPTYSFASKRIMKNKGPKFVIGLGMDALGYILTPEFFSSNPKVKHARYLTEMSIDSAAGSILMKFINLLAIDN